ncbi:MAG: hypothetical protein V4538_17710 [Bacteroidota bacterium]
MAKVNGPFMSLDASGTFGKTLTASKWKGRPYMRLRVIPSNPSTSGQEAVRSILGTLAKACTAVLTSFADMAGVGSPFFVAARDGAPSGQSWISWLQKVMYPAFGARVTAYAGLSGTITGYYQSTATAIGLSAYVDKSGDTHTAGEQLFMLAYFATTYLGITVGGGYLTPTNGGAVDSFGDDVHLTV